MVTLHLGTLRKVLSGAPERRSANFRRGPVTGSRPAPGTLSADLVVAAHIGQTDVDSAGHSSEDHPSVGPLHGRHKWRPGDDPAWKPGVKRRHGPESGEQ